MHDGKHCIHCIAERQRRARIAHLSSASSSEFPDSIILCWASLCRSVSAGVAPIRTMASPTCTPHLAAKLPGVTYNRVETVTRWLDRPAVGVLPFSAAAPGADAAAMEESREHGVCSAIYLDTAAKRTASAAAAPPLIKYRNRVACGVGTDAVRRHAYTRTRLPPTTSAC